MIIPFVDPIVCFTDTLMLIWDSSNNGHARFTHAQV
jgi:hypothetical protein